MGPERRRAEEPLKSSGVGAWWPLNAMTDAYAESSNSRRNTADRCACRPSAIGQIWRDGTWQACLARLARSGLLDVQDLDLDEARTAGSLWGLTGTADVAEASVALLARRHQALVITSDPDDLRRLDADLQLITC
jgi:hypothetical protein